MACVLTMPFFHFQTILIIIHAQSTFRVVQRVTLIAQSLLDPILTNYHLHNYWTL